MKISKKGMLLVGIPALMLVIGLQRQERLAPNPSQTSFPKLASNVVLEISGPVGGSEYSGIPYPGMRIKGASFRGGQAVERQNDLGRATWTVDVLEAWKASMAQAEGTRLEKSYSHGGAVDLMGDGALLLQKTDSDRPFNNVDHFVESGTWTSTWHNFGSEVTLQALRITLLIYGQKQTMQEGWTKFEDNPLVAGRGWKHNTDETLALPDTLWPQDQALARGTGNYEGQWLLFFNVGAWAVGGWAAAVADRLAPLKRGVNPFRLIEPYPLFTSNARGDTLGYHAPNDWIAVGGIWYAPDESRDRVSRMWTSAGLVDWTNQGPMEGIQGHDPGLVYDGKRFHLFTENDNRIGHCYAEDPLGQWTCTGTVLEVGHHTGDADVSFFNNRWHLFFDDAPHRHYDLGYAWTTPSAFPRGWRMTNDIFGPHNPEQGQVWDNPTPAGNRFGTGDADIALEGTTLYLTYERPIGIAYKELKLTGGNEQTVQVKVEMDADGDGAPDASTRWHVLSAGASRWTGGEMPALQGERFRVRLKLETENPDESPMVTNFELDVR